MLVREVSVSVTRSITSIWMSPLPTLWVLQDIQQGKSISTQRRLRCVAARRARRQTRTCRGTSPANSRLYSRTAETAAKLFVVTSKRKIVTAAEMDRMSPQERADAIDASVVRDWNRVPPTLRREIVATAHRLDAERCADA